MILDLLNHGAAAGRQDTQDFVHGNIAEVLGHEQVDQIVDIGQVSAVEGIGRYRTAPAHRMNVLTSRRNVLCLHIEALDEIAVGGM